MSVLRNVLSREFGRDEARAILAAQQRRYDELHAGRPVYAQRALRIHLEEHILPGLALYQVLLERGMEQAAAQRIVQAVLDERLLSQRRALVWLSRISPFFSVLRWVLPGNMRRDFPAEGWDTEWVEVGPRLVAFNMHRCFYLDTLRAYGAPELTASFCAWDDMLLANVSSDMRWARTMTLGRGDRMCDFRFERIARGKPALTDSGR